MVYISRSRELILELIQLWHALKRVTASLAYDTLTILHILIARYFDCRPNNKNNTTDNKINKEITTI